MGKPINPIVKNALDGLTAAYTESEGRTKAGIFLRLILRAVPLGALLDAIVYKHK